MTDAKKVVPDLPDIGGDPTRFLTAVREVIQTREGRRGNPLDKAVTFRELLDLGLILRNAAGRIEGGATGAPGPVGPAGPAGPPGTPYTPDYTPPPTPTGLTAVSMFRGAYIEWDAPTYTQGHGNAYTKIYVAQYGGTGPEPTFAGATAAGQAGGSTSMYMHDAAMGAMLHVWVSFVSVDGVEGPPAGGTNGFEITIGRVGNADLGALIVEAGNLASGAVTASKLAAAAVEYTAFAAGIRPPRVVGALPALPAAGYAEGDTVVLTTDGLLYRLKDGAWTAAVPAANVTGQLVASQLNVGIGGGNLLPNSAFKATSGTYSTGLDSWAEYNNGVTASTLTVYPGGPFNTNFLNVTAVASTTQSLGIYTTTAVAPNGGVRNWTPGLTYTISFWARAASASMVGRTMAGLYSNMNWSSSSVVQNPPLQLTTWQRYVFRAVPNNNGLTPLGELFISYETSGTLPAGAAYELCAVQVEQGDMATAYAPRPDEILPSTITATEIADNAITTPKLVAGAVVAGKIAANAVEADKIAANAVTTDKLAANAVTAAKITAGAIETDKLAANAITTAKLAAGAVTADQIAAGAIRTSKLLVQPASLFPEAYPTDPAFWAFEAGWYIDSSPASGAVLGLGSVPSCLTWYAPGTVGRRHAYGGFSTRIPITAGKEYIARWRWVRTGDCSDQFRVAIYYFDSAFGITTADYSAFMSAAGTFDGSMTFTPPVGAMYFALLVFNEDVVTPWAGFFAITNFRVVEKAGADLIVDGSIVATKLAANSIAVGTAAIENGAIVNAMIGTAAIDDAKIANLSAAKVTFGTMSGDRIEANTLHADRITTGTLSAAQIATGFLSADRINTGSLSGDKITANTLNADRIQAGTLSASQISTGTLSADRIAAGSIVTSKIQVGDVTESVLGGFVNQALTITGNATGELALTVIGNYTRYSASRPIIVHVSGVLEITLRNTGWSAGTYHPEIQLWVGTTGLSKLIKSRDGGVRISPTGVVTLFWGISSSFSVDTTMFPVGVARDLRVSVSYFAFLNDSSLAVAALTGAGLSLDVTLTEMKV